jgi:dTDP-glucose pyrophosphorylase
MSVLEERWRKAMLPRSATIGEVIHTLDVVAFKIVLIANAEDVLEGTVSDGDIRRALLRGQDLSSPIHTVMNRNAVVVTPELNRALVLQLMVANKIQQIPIVNEHHRIVGLHLWDEINTTPARPNLMVIMAGGFGTRLYPHTQNVPKPMLPLAGKPMLQHIIERGRHHGFRNFVIATHYLGDTIEAYFGNGDKFGISVNYIREQTPLGTAGALSLLNPLPEHPFVVTNGDVISDIHYGELLDFHIRNLGVATMAIREYEWQCPFGVVQTDGVEIVGIDEKPMFRSHINAGIYALNPVALSGMVDAVPYDMPSLFHQLRSLGLPTFAYPMHEPWLDVGRIDDLTRANEHLIRAKRENS